VAHDQIPARGLSVSENLRRPWVSENLAMADPTSTNRYGGAVESLRNTWLGARTPFSFMPCKPTTVTDKDSTGKKHGANERKSTT
jgi:hypothetical protein